MLSNLSLDELRDRLEDIKDNIEALTREIHRVEVAIEKENENIEECDHILKDEAVLNSLGFSRFISEFSTKANELLFKNFLEAITIAPEYDYPTFIGGFREAAFNDKTISIKFDPSSLVVKEIVIDLDLTAGTLEEYAAAIKAVRTLFGWGVTRGKSKQSEGYDYETDFADLATRIWYNKIYAVDRLGARVFRRYVKKAKKGQIGKQYVEKDVTKRYKGKYAKTIAARQEAFVKPAPWWRLLEYGNATAEGEAEAAPTNPATKFVGKTKETLITTWEEDYKQIKLNVKNEYELSKSISLRAIRKLEVYLEELNDAVFEETPEFEVSLDEIINYLKNLGKYENADIVKLKKRADQLSRGEEIGRVSLGGGVRIRTIELSRDIQEAIDVMRRENESKKRDVG